MPVSRSTLTVIVCSTLLLAGCATQPAAPPEQRSPADPWEPLNRRIHGFNQGLDAVTFKPVAKGYRWLFPQWMRTGVTNFSRNLSTPLNIINNFLQGKVKNGFSETGRLLANSTFGLGGLVDVATDMGLERKQEDFGETFAVWGIPDGPFVVVPVLGPRTLRDAIAIPLNIMGDAGWHVDNASVRTKLYVVRLVDVRARLLRADDLIKDSPDRYVTIREAYLQNRLFLIHDGFPPEDDIYEDDFYDEFDEEETDQDQ